jgi:hypothetical protein
MRTLLFLGGLALFTGCTSETPDSEETAECGDGVLNGDEACDGTDLGSEDCLTQGFEFGDVTCSDTCELDTSACRIAECGDGVLEGDEACDLQDFGDATCESLGEDDGVLMCAEDCSAIDTTGCDVCYEPCNDLWACTQTEVDGEKLCVGLDAEDEGDFVQGCMDNPSCAAMSGFINADDCAKTVATIKGLSADFAESCDN